MALGYSEADRRARMTALVEGAQALEARWQPIRSFLADASPVSLLAPLDRVRDGADLERAVDAGLEQLTALRADGRAMNLPVPSVARKHRAYVSGSAYDDLRQHTDAAFFSWLAVKAFLEREAFPTIQAIYLLSANPQRDDLARGLSGKLSAIVRKGVSLGLPAPASPFPSAFASPSVAIKGTIMNDLDAAKNYESYGRNAAGGGLAQLAQVIDPVGRGARVSFDLSSDAMLTVEICVDGRCYQATSDVRDLLSGVDAWAMQYHRHLHNAMDASSARDLPAPVQSAGYALVGALLDEHVGVVCGGFWSSLKGGISGATKAIRKTVKKMKGPIAVAAGIAAGAAASALPGGVVIAPMAAKFANSMVNAAAGEGSVKAAAEAALAEAKVAATVDPDVKKALGKAQAAVAKTAAAYHVADVAEAAGLGDTAAMKQLKALAAAAEKGDPAAKKVMELAQGVTLAEMNNAAMGGGAGAASSVAGVIIGRTADPFVTASKERATTYAVNRVTKGRREPFGYVHLMTGQRFAHTFKTLDDADDWFGRLEPGTYVYAAYYNPRGEMFPLPENDAEFHPAIVANAQPRMTRAPATISGCHIGARDPIFVDVPTVDEDGNYTGLAVKWPTSQSARHGGIPDGYADLQHKGLRAYFWLPPGITSPLDLTEETKPLMRWWQPPWRPTPHRLREPSVQIEAVETVPTGPTVTIESVRPISRAQAAHEVAHAVAVQGIPAWGPFALGAALGVGTIAAYEWYERRQAAKRARTTQDVEGFFKNAAPPIPGPGPNAGDGLPPVSSAGWY